MNCQEMEKFWPLYLSGDLSGRKKRRFEEHLLACSKCRTLKSSFDRSAALAFEVLREPVELSRSEWERIRPRLPETRALPRRLAWGLVGVLVLVLLVAFLAMMRTLTSERGRGAEETGATYLAERSGPNEGDRYEVRMSTSDPRIKIVWVFDRNVKL